MVAEITHHRDAAQAPLALSVAGRADASALDTASDQCFQGLTTLLRATSVRVRLAQKLWRDPLGDGQRLRLKLLAWAVLDEVLVLLALLGGVICPERALGQIAGLLRETAQLLPRDLLIGDDHLLSTQVLSLGLAITGAKLLRSGEVVQ